MIDPARPRVFARRAPRAFARSHGIGHFVGNRKKPDK
jgi:hypothetical protein